MSAMDLLIAAGIATAATGGVGKHHASKTGTPVSFTQAIPLGAKVMTAPLVEKAKTSAAQAREQRRIRKQMAGQGFAPFGKPATAMPPNSYKNPSGLEEYATARPTVMERLRDAFSVKRFTQPRDGRNPANPDARDASGGPAPAEQEQPPVQLTPEQDRAVWKRIQERIHREAPDEDDAGGDARVVVINQIVVEEFDRAAQEFTPTTDSEGNPMSQAVPMYTSELDLHKDHAEALVELGKRLDKIRNDPALNDAAKNELVRNTQDQFNGYWDARGQELSAYLSSPQAQGRCRKCGHDLRMPDPRCEFSCNGCGCGQAAQANTSAGPAVPAEVVTAPMDYLEAVLQFAAAGMTRMSIPAIIAYLATAGEAFTQLSGVLRQLAARLDEEAMFDDKVLENIRAAATMADLAGIKFTTASQVSGTLYRQWIEACRNGARVPSQGVLAATNS